MRPSAARTAVAVGVALLLIGAAASLQAARDRWMARPPVPERLLYLQSGAAVQRMALGFDPLVADLYWIRAVQHYGGDRLGRATGRRYELLHPLLDITTTLDPHFSIAYRFGAFFLADEYPSGAGRPDQAIALLEKGLRAEPQKWEYAQDIGFVHFWSMGDFAGAAEWYLRASKMPGAPDWMGPLAASMAMGSDRRQSRFLWEQLLETTESDWIRRSAQQRVQQLDAMDQIDRFNEILRARAAELPSGPLTWEQVIRAGVARRVPLDPAGVPYAIDGERREVMLSPESPLYPLPRMPEARVGVTP
jgi:tetratricopeptide (TPR) repeat protein